MTVEQLISILEGCPKEAIAQMSYWNEHGEQDCAVTSVEIWCDEKNKEVRIK